MINTVKIIAEFLKDRFFLVKCEGEKSILIKIECGVPQGGVLSPTLFSIYINDVPIAEGDDEISLLFADDIAYSARYGYKTKNKIDSSLKIRAQEKVQAYLNKLELWMCTWRLSLAPSKCAQITFSKAKDISNDEMEITLYNEKIPSEINPKFLGIFFDARLNFSKHWEAIREKITDRLNLLKILSYDKNWRLNEDILIKMYKTLVRSVLDYACVTSVAASNVVLKDFEVAQNDALRIIFKKSLLDKVKVEELRDRAGVQSIFERHKILMERYYERAIISEILF